MYCFIYAGKRPWRISEAQEEEIGEDGDMTTTVNFRLEGRQVVGLHRKKKKPNVSRYLNREFIG